MNKQTEKKYNTTITALWENEKFGEGALLSAEIDDKAFEALQTVEKGTKLLIKPRERDGKTTFFMEVLPPYSGGPAKPGFKAKSAPARRKAAEDDDV